MSDEKATFIKGVWIREHTFQDGGSILNLSISAKTFSEQIATHTDEKGYVRLTIGKRRTPDEHGVSHFMKLDTFKPKSKEAAEAPY